MEVEIPGVCEDILAEYPTWHDIGIYKLFTQELPFSSAKVLDPVQRMLNIYNKCKNATSFPWMHDKAICVDYTFEYIVDMLYTTTPTMTFKNGSIHVNGLKTSLQCSYWMPQSHYIFFEDEQMVENIIVIKPDTTPDIPETVKRKIYSIYQTDMTLMKL